MATTTCTRFTDEYQLYEELGNCGSMFRVPVHCLSIFPSTVTSIPGPAEEKHPHSMILPPPCVTLGIE
ncbi:hypothetical protein ILYODFUR_013732 [Ilyodon furcidens]|uniref:Uncharacterized protein n=2 Tax=Goodeidae TaxID=28758 RepID=A0ABV0V6D8_9TELE